MCFAITSIPNTSNNNNKAPAKPHRRRLLQVILITILSLASSYTANHVCFGFVRTTRPFSRRALSSLRPLPSSRSDSMLSAAKKADAAADVGYLKKGDTLLPDWMIRERVRLLTPKSTIVKVAELVKEREAALNKETERKDNGCVVYWMQRDVRTVDNWALSYAMFLSQLGGVPLRVVYTLPPPPPLKQDGDVNEGEEEEEEEFPPALIDMPLPERYGSFLLGGLREVHKELNEKDVPFHVLKPKSQSRVGDILCKKAFEKYGALIVVCDFSPLRHVRDWVENQTLPQLSQKEIPLFQVDAHNVVPVWLASPKREVGARTLRPKINKLVPDILKKERYPEFVGNDHLETPLNESSEFDYDRYERYLQLDTTVPSMEAKPGTRHAMKQYEFFVQNGLKQFDTHRNDPNAKTICSNLSPWINHGHVSFQRILLEVRNLNKYANGTASFVEEGLIRRELSDNFCYYSPGDYDALETAAGWAYDTLQVHANDEREYVYTTQQLEEGRTHDDLWNAAQLQVVREGQMHGFLRMYWAKKILEWTPSPGMALRTAQYFNDKYALDGRDPNGFVGVGWSIMGIHDQGWKERPTFGKIRFMNYAGCKRKFKVAQFVQKYRGASENALAATGTPTMTKFVSSSTTGKTAQKVRKGAKMSSSSSAAAATTTATKRTKKPIAKNVNKKRKIVG